MSHGFVLLAGGASFNVVCHPLFHPGPLGVLTCLLESFVPSRMSGRRVVVVNGHQGTLFKEGEVTLDPIGPEFVFRDQHHVLIVPVSMVCPQRVR